ncbi:ABC transporter [Rhodothalassium salexigens]|uniref:ABC transporter ATP-binding protein n=1 Tax=Rhodothalassium salexigens TaxID=1086 RepID=UPI00191228A5|nr:ABC transporter ATP-binding protein [Rhodothalassium salexigens]MBK5910706.1 ABC transporter [Rhodothalassium salexigens]MBK5921664.1 ABC transporter [Rhodothalassium salexigens]
MTWLTLEDVSVSLGRTEVLSGLDLGIGAGELVGLIGPNGAGKSTLIRAMMGLIPVRGRCLLGGDPVRGLRPSERARRVSYVAQEREIGWPVSVERIVALGRDVYRKAGRGLSSRDRAMIERAIAHMDIEALRHRPATDLSGGERARVLIARALAQDTPLMLADEPTAGLDPAHQISLMSMLASLAADGRGIVASLHDLGLAARWCTRLVLLDRGRIVADGAPEAVLTPEVLARVYGVKAHLSHHEGGLIVQPLSLVRPANPENHAAAAGSPG